MSNRYWMISFHKNTRNLTVRSVPKKDIAHNIELIIRPLNIPIEKFLSIEYTTWDLRAPAPTPSHLRATVAIKGSFRGAEF